MKKLIVVGITLVMALSLLVINAGAVLATNQGLTPGYWKNHTENWPDYAQRGEYPNYGDPYTLDEIFFACDISALPNVDIAALGEDTLLDALNYKGGKGDDGGARILLRAAAAAYLNIATRVPGNSNPGTPDVAYPMNIGDVVYATCQALNGDTIDVETPEIHIEGMTYRARMLALKDIFDKYNNYGL